MKTKSPQDYADLGQTLKIGITETKKSSQDYADLGQMFKIGIMA